MSRKAVEKLKDKIILMLQEGSSIREIERRLRPEGLVKMDIQRYFEEVTGHSYKEYQKERKKEDVPQEVRALEERLKALEEKVREFEKRIEIIEENAGKMQGKRRKKEGKSLIELRGIYKSKKKIVYSFRLIEDLKEKMKEKAEKEGLNLNELINIAIMRYLGY